MGADASRLTERWLERIVVGLGLCPFAAPVVEGGALDILVSDARDEDTLVADLDNALRRLAATPAHELETLLVVVEYLLGDFDDFNQFLDVADALVAARGLSGVIQVASFHPHYAFEGARADDAANWTNRAPYPTLHLLREASVARAVAAHGDTAAIPGRNQRLLRGMSAAEIARLFGA